ncbi:hypothetical protein [Micromonospora pattaloongensis]|uniref:hypothetical protein n=1 Tax=Micromonospora pattaloongensis TaxID=405436 RepID=UPI0011154330|nr:hypothetical protein [Micromonospora pattaloongensis]
MNHFDQFGIHLTEDTDRSGVVGTVENVHVERVRDTAGSRTGVTHHVAAEKTKSADQVQVNIDLAQLVEEQWADRMYHVLEVIYRLRFSVRVDCALQLVTDEIFDSLTGFGEVPPSGVAERAKVPGLGQHKHSSEGDRVGHFAGAGLGPQSGMGHSVHVTVLSEVGVDVISPDIWNTCRRRKTAENLVKSASRIVGCERLTYLVQEHEVADDTQHIGNAA